MKTRHFLGFLPPVLRSTPVLVLALTCMAAPASAQMTEDPDWPCIQRKVPHLSVAQLWSGPPVPEDNSWRDDAAVARLASMAAARRTDIDELPPLLAELGSTEEHSREDRLVALFGGAFQSIDRERTRIIAGIERFARKHRALAERIDRRDEELRTAEETAAPDDYDELDRIEEMQDQQEWDIRIYQDRQKSLTYVCETPVILERRAFAIARMIQTELGEQ